MANAIGSALCQVSGRIDIMATIDPDVENAAEKVLEELKSSAIEAAVANGAVMSTIEVCFILRYTFLSVQRLPLKGCTPFRMLKYVSLASKFHIIYSIWSETPSFCDRLSAWDRPTFLD